ncbi:efflux RND transporter periplasmic adaptor subunit [Xanthomonas sp. CFBP 8445]|uniref:efflux RND transporter periplasmic adaptor subunit n=1 Tax=Xanthomonas sp. CFBP 8445 TaxID=2971236 RepID=UPI0021DFF1D4|nr:efflux RND transporter periplasmic adaptor subunit [Xanthomonas sp. CFBP 8445]UYC13175.1 efflux RND transporter periplasmic adaptor subunit [Xanthomonas sp. CFBP 8445]
MHVRRWPICSAGSAERLRWTGAAADTPSGGNGRATVAGVLASLAMLALAGCRHDAAAVAPPPLPALATAPVVPAAMASRSWDGVVAAVDHADLSAQTDGRVRSVAVDVGDRVVAGQLLLQLSAVEQRAGVDSAQAQLRAAMASAGEAEASYRRYAALADAQYVSRAQLDQARATRDAARAARAAAEAQVAQAQQPAAYTVVRAPFAGVISARHVQPGEAVAAGQALLSLYVPGSQRIEVQVPQSDAAGVRAAPRAQVLLDDGRTLQVPQVTVFPTADPRSHSVTVRVPLPALQPAPAPGTTAKVDFPLAAGDAAEATPLSIPRSALLQRGELSAAYVLADGRLVLRQLQIGRRDAQRVEVLAGLRAGERVARDPVAAGQALVAQRRALAEH